MSSPTVVHVSLTELEARRRLVLERLGMASQDELERRSAHYTLTPDEWDARDELREIAFLLGE